MAKPEDYLALAVDVVRKLSSEGHDRRLARRKRQRRQLRRIARTAALLVVATFVIITGMIASGLLFGKYGIEGVVSAPLILIATWSSILYWMFGRTRSPRTVIKADLAQLPAQTGEWLEDARGKLPWAAQQKLDDISVKLESLTPQLQALNPQAPAALEVRRLLSEELVELVRGYDKVPKALAQKPLYGGPSPERQLIEGLDTIGKQLARMEEKLAVDDMHALATHQRYLDLKYNRKDEIE